ncbi:Aerobic respiration control sensor protein ArcB [Blastopirellula retiformator]|uniref:histidine kinase n=2 Tax=Blastopirellula retiformator TaxID=2527970 RepID=A0A5C5V9D5_9BACT|nr:Aerobic respiration control sensor protein ArcB [Blastopirellula retiformator]
MANPVECMSRPAAAASTRRLTTLYITALSIVALLTIVGQLLIRQSINQQQGDSTLVNVAGRQRMLSQRIAKYALALRDPNANDQEAIAGLRESLQLWEKSHQALLERDASANIAGANSAAVEQMYATINPDFRLIESSSHAILDAADDPENVAAAVNVILQHEQAFLDGMDKIVFQYELEALERVNRLRHIESLLMTITLMVLLLEGFFIFRPAVGEIHRSLHTQAQMNEQLQAEKENAEEANRVKTRFLAKMSHEIRTPMNAILGLSESLSEAVPDERQRRQATVVNDSARSLMSLLNDLLDVSTMELESTQPLSLKPFPLASLLRRTHEMFAFQAQQKQIRFPLTIDPGLDVLVLGDELRTRQILVNLIQNALKFVENGYVEIEATLLKQDERSLTARFLVRDSGPGIPPEQFERIFEAFSQLGTTTGSTRGVGLGLHISQRLAQEMGGRLQVTSEVGVGSEFALEIPLEKSDASISEEPSDAAAPNAYLKILVVEDLEANQLVLQEILSRLGLTACFVSDGQSAFTAVAETTFDVVLLDLELPDMSGLDVARKLRELPNEKRLFIIAVTAHAIADYEQSTLAAGADKFLTKPLSLEDLRDCLNQAPTPMEAPIQISPALREKLISLFLEQAPSALENLREAGNSRDNKRLAFAAHRLRGMIAYFDAPKSSSLLAKLDEDDLQLEKNEIDSILQEVEISVAQLQRELGEQIPESP